MDFSTINLDLLRTLPEYNPTANQSVFPSYREARAFVDALANGGAA